MAGAAGSGLPRFEAIVVGGGPSGLAAAYTMADAGMRVAVIERGDWSGSKNMMGGMIFTYPTATVIPDFWKEAPLERHITRRDFWICTKDATIRGSYETEDFGVEPCNAYSVFRSRFDKWLAGQAKAKGAYLITETLVEDLIQENGRVTGVRTGRPDGDLRADVVILAEGVNTFLTEKAGLGPGMKSEYLALGVKEILSLPKEKIEDRFNLEGDQGVAIEAAGETTAGLPGTGFIYTNRSTISIGVGVMLKDMVDRVTEPYFLLERFKEQPQVRRLISGTSPLEYSAHLIPEGGLHNMPRLCANGALVVGDAAGMVNAVHTEGANLALLSGKMAADTVIRCRGLGDYSARALSHYCDLLDQSLIMRDLKKYQDVAPFLARHPQLFRLYPEVMSTALKELLTVDMLSKSDKHRLIAKLVHSEIPVRRLARDIYDIWRTLA
ncbi:MAG: FAD-binding protein [Thermoleophilia bacterium]|nr:FAD-binding protein [Thermoleophilia bacterium]